MTCEQPNVVLDGRYSIKDTCSILGICRETLFRYTHVTGDIRCGIARRGGRERKFYTGKEILRFWNKQR